MNVKIVSKESFSVIGKMVQGKAGESQIWISQVWREANSDFGRIAPFVKYNENGEIFGLWGLMSDIDEKFARWGDSGKYLAGCEADHQVLPPIGFVKWTLPAQTYVVAGCSGHNYGEVFQYVVNEYIPQNNMRIIGAIHEHYPVPGNPECIELYVPVAKLEDTMQFTMCGYSCELCQAYGPNIQKHDRRNRLSQIWAKYFPGLDIAPEEINCDGCRAMEENAKRIDEACPVRSCVLQRGLEHCGYCSDYPCDVSAQREGLTCEAAKANPGFCQKEYDEFLLAYDNKTRLTEFKKKKEKSQ